MVKVALAFVFVLTLSLPAFAQTVRPGGACLRATGAVELTSTSGVELEAGSKGVVVTWIIHDGAAGDYGITISDASLMNADLAVKTLQEHGQIALTSIVRGGRDSTGDLPDDGDYVSLRTQPTTIPHLFIPPGKFLTVRQTSVNTAAVVSLCFHEPPR